MKSQARNTNCLRNPDDFITQKSEKIECRVTKNCLTGSVRRKIEIFSVLSELGKFLQNAQAGAHSGLVPETSGV